jgi:hypothetical protein
MKFKIICSYYNSVACCNVSLIALVDMARHELSSTSAAMLCNIRRHCVCSSLGARISGASLRREGYRCVITIFGTSMDDDVASSPQEHQLETIGICHFPFAKIHCSVALAFL